MKSSYLFCLCLFLCLNLNGQKSHLIVNAFIKLPSDTIQSKKLIEALDNFLTETENPNESNKYVLPEEKIQTFVLLDEIKGMGYSGKYKDENFYKPYLTNVVELKDHQFLIQITYMGAAEHTPLLRAGFEIIAHKNKESFLFASPLTYRTRDWKTLHDGNFVIHFRNSLDKNKVANHIKLSNIFDQKLNNLNNITEYYCCENFPELQQLIGISYKADYNGSVENVLSATDGHKKLIMLGDDNANFQHVDSHDLWHDRLSLAISRNDVYKPVDEACAYLYGGSWGISWKEILEQFKSKVAIDKKTDWMDIKLNPLNFGVSQDKHLYADYVVNALLLEKIEKEHGFNGVWLMLKSIDEQKGNDLYYSNLEKLTGITRDNYNEKVWELISTLD